VLVVLAPDHIAECTFADDFLDLVAETYLITLLETVVTFVIIEAIIDEALQLGRLIFYGLWCDKPDVFELINFCFLVWG